MCGEPAEPRADGQNRVAGAHRVITDLARIAADDADRQIVHLVNRALAAERCGDGDRERFVETSQLLPGLRIDHTLTSDDQRTFGLSEELDEAPDFLKVGHHTAGIEMD